MILHYPFPLCNSEAVPRMVLESGAGRALRGPCVHTWLCLHLLHTHTAELMPDSLSCFMAAAPEVRVVLHARTGPDSQLEKVFSGNWFLPKALFVLPVPGDTEEAGHTFAFSLNTFREDFAELVPEDFAKCCSS